MILTEVTRVKFMALKQKLSTTHSSIITGIDAGAISGNGVTANYRYDENQKTLTVDVVHHPFFIPISEIQTRLSDVLSGLPS